MSQTITVGPRDENISSNEKVCREKESSMVEIGVAVLLAVGGVITAITSGFDAYKGIKARRK